MEICNLHKKDKLVALGLMSGTSMDGLDICQVEIIRKGKDLDANMINFASYQYDPKFKNYIEDKLTGQTQDICRANFDISRQWSKMVERFFKENNIDKSVIDVIGSHGQTIWHEHGHSTLQIGEPAVLAEDLEIPVIADFRVNDVAAGGSGAPLVPFIDYLWFNKYSKTFLLLNIGGIANFTIIPENAQSNQDIYALDTGPGNGLIDGAISLATQGKLTYDRDGKWAKAGKIDLELLEDLHNNPYFEKSLPKSTGKEVFGSQFVKSLVEKYGIKTRQDFQNLIATLTRFTAETIFKGYKQFFADQYELDEIVVSGGGARNPLIMQYLKELFEDVEFSSPHKYNLDIDAKESLAFAMLAALRVWEIPANVPNATGADRSVMLGKIIYT